VARRLFLGAACAAALLAPDVAAASAGVHVHAAFGARSYRPGQTAALRIFDSPSRSLVVDVFSASGLRNRSLTAVSVRPTRHIVLRGKRPWTLRFRLGHWRSGVYLVRLTTARGGAVGYAPLILRPLFLGAHRTLVVEPTNTWQAYNFWAGDSWYLHKEIWKIDLTRPYAGRGLPPHFAAYDLGFLRWFAANRASADFVSDDDLGHFLSGKHLRRLYDLIVFPGHEEYVTRHVYDVIEGFRNRGGSLAFLSANNFFWQVERHGQFMTGRSRWDKIGRPEAALVGAAYHGWESRRYRNHPYIVFGAKKLPWLFAGTGLRNGEAFGSYGIEIDQRRPSSPRNVIVAARIPKIFGRGHSAEMTYYRRGHAQVFDAGVLNFGGGLVVWPAAATMLRNLWVHLGGELPRVAGSGAAGQHAAGPGGEGHLHRPAGSAVLPGLDDRNQSLDSRSARKLPGNGDLQLR
jgi:hypothetical protein